MRNPSTDFLTALVNAKEDGIIPRRFVYVHAFNRTTGDPEPVGFWTGDYNVTVTLLDGQSGTNVSRLYYGMGRSCVVDEIPRVSDLTIQTVECGVSQINPIIQQMVRGSSIRLAKVEIHEGLLSTESRELVSNPELVFLGQIDGDPIQTPAAEGEGSISLKIVSDAIRSLTRRNPAKSSYEQQQRRNGDQFNKYANVTGTWQILWGESNEARSGVAEPSNKRPG